MSWEASAYAKKIRTCPNGEAIERQEKYMLLILADYHNTEWDYACPSVKALAYDALYSEREVGTILSSLVRKGVLRTVVVPTVSKGQSRTKYWFIQIEKAHEVSSRATPGNVGAHEVLGGAHEVVTNDLRKPPIRTSNSSRRGAKAPGGKANGKVDLSTYRNLGPLFAAFAAVGATRPPLPKREHQIAQFLQANYGAEIVAKCWHAIETGTWGTDAMRASLSFYTISMNNRIENFKRDTANGTRTVAKRGYVTQASPEQHAEYTASARRKYEHQQSQPVSDDVRRQVDQILQAAQNDFASVNGHTES